MSEVHPSESVEQLREAAVSALNSADSAEQIESWRVDFLGRKGRLTALLRGLGSLEIEERKVVGAQRTFFVRILIHFMKNAKDRQDHLMCLLDH